LFSEIGFKQEPMARLPRVCLPGVPQHVIQRGNNRQVCFGSDEHFAAYAFWLGEYSQAYGVAIHAWVFMTNHVHLLLTPSDREGVSATMQSLGRRYVRYFNRCYKRSGTLWEGRFKSCVVDADAYLLICQRYIELNPVRAGMVEKPEDYCWSSYHANGLGQQPKLWTPHPIYQGLGKTSEERADTYRSLFVGHIDDQILTQIRTAAKQGMALGNDRFKEEVERLARRRVRVLKKGRKPRMRG
jgi:putative transposase